ncbi:enoyl-CoA hydratase [Rhodococcus sp. WS3]|uniref:enoyl-CoA hydratase/isomerase family protein n=1 Tax=Rhodococcus sp. WS3 TaxID=2486271 RepID=UPI0011424E8B|nr:enoyl-CoA hydratase-related protein [Rhodococcus sp. WS3]ROZ45664.1 enoyl-CoA hydratase [Rhodococcus sp. WS3]
MSVDCERDEGVVTITLNRPEKLNAMTDAMWSTLDALLAELVVDPDTRAVVITGAGGVFCGGSDVEGLLDDLDGLPDRIRVSNRCVERVHSAPFPTVAMVDGIAAGSGANLALACDFVVVSERAKFLQLFIRRGLSLDSGASWLLPRLVGDRRARQLAILGDSLDAATALEWGMVTAVAPVERLMEEVAALTDRFRKLAPRAVAGTKELLCNAWAVDLPTALGDEIANQVAVILSAEAQDAIRGFGK